MSYSILSKDNKFIPLAFPDPMDPNKTVTIYPSFKNKNDASKFVLTSGNYTMDEVKICKTDTFIVE